MYLSCSCDLFVIIVMISICSSGRSDPDQHLRPCDVAQHQVQQRGKLQEVLRLRHRPPQVCFKLSEILTTDHRFFSMSSLHIWFSKLKWSLDVLLRFYERHAFICALHKVSNISSLAFLLSGTLHWLILSFLEGNKVAVRRAQLLPPATVQHPLPRRHALQRLNPRGDHHCRGENALLLEFFPTES